MRKTTKLKQRLQNGELVVGTFQKIRGTQMTDLLCAALEPDFIILDGEHSGFSYADIEESIRAAETFEVDIIVRVPALREEYILHAMDAGACGVQVPGIASVEEAREAVSYARYAPDGTRGLSNIQRGNYYGNWKEPVSYTEFSNAHGIVSLHVENVQMLDRVEELCQIDGVDVLFIGPADLKQSFRSQGIIDNEEIEARILNGIQQIVSHRKVAGIFAGSIEKAGLYVKTGARYIALNSDAGLISSTFHKTAENIREISQ